MMGSWTTIAAHSRAANVKKNKDTVGKRKSLLRKWSDTYTRKESEMNTANPIENTDKQHKEKMSNRPVLLYQLRAQLFPRRTQPETRLKTMSDTWIT